MKDNFDLRKYLAENRLTENKRVPPHLYPSHFRDYFSDIHYDTLMRQYNKNIAPEFAQALNGKWYEVSSHINSWGDRVVKLKLAKNPK